MPKGKISESYTQFLSNPQAVLPIRQADAEHNEDPDQPAADWVPIQEMLDGISSSLDPDDDYTFSAVKDQE